MARTIKATQHAGYFDALNEVLKYAADRDAPQLQVNTESQLLIQQMLGKYKVRDAALVPLYKRACSLAAPISVDFRKVYEKQNKVARELARVAAQRAA